MEIPSWFIAGKAAIWLALPLAYGIWELRRHNKMMARDREAARASEAQSNPGEELQRQRR